MTMRTAQGHTGTAAAAAMMTLAEAHALLPGSRLVGNGAVRITRVHSDTRSLQAGDLFVALRGERFDGHDHLAAAQAGGAAGALAEFGRLAGVPSLSGTNDTRGPLSGLEVNDTLLALQHLAAAWRAPFTALPLIAVTGSNGKTTVTQMLASIQRAACGDDALATLGNLNNHIGVPLTLLRLRPHHRCAVLELGTNHAGEIALLADLVRPTVALMTNAQREHQEFLHGVEAVARENGSVIPRVPMSGTVALPQADAYTPLWREMAGPRRVLTFGFEAGADVSGQAKWVAGSASGAPTSAGVPAATGAAVDAGRSGPAWSLVIDTPMGRIETTLRQPGRHNALNALAAVAGALAAGLPLAAAKQGLADFEPVAGRTRVLTLRRAGAAMTLVDDSYNANPDSVRAAIDLLADMPGPRWLVLGDMGEVGNQGPLFHAEVGAHARERGIEHCWSAGPLSAGLGFAADMGRGTGRHFADTATLIAALIAPLSEAPAAASVLVKGSRFMQMEAVVRAMQHAWNSEGRADAA